MSGTLQAPICGIDIYPWESPALSIQGGQVLECTTSHDIRSNDPERCRIVLAPGGPYGVATGLSWAQIITLQSLVVVAMQRGAASQVVFVGYVRAVGESQQWQAARKVIRVTTIEAVGWKGWFEDFQWSALSFLGASNGVAAAAVAGLANPDTGVPTTVLNAGQLNGNPAQIASGWLGTIMGGASGIMAQTMIPYQGNRGLLWPGATTSEFQIYPFNVTFPSSYWYISQAGNWLAKFQEILNYPWYETIIGTAPTGIWFVPGSSPDYYQSGQVFSSQTMPQAIPVQAQIVGRIMPLPDLLLRETGSPGIPAGTVSVESSPSFDASAIPTQASSGLAGQQAYAFQDQATLDLWNDLPLFQPDPNQGFIQSTASLSLAAYYNFFVLTPTFIRAILNQSDAAQNVFPYAYVATANPASIHRYGFKSLQLDFHWFSDVAQLAAQSSSASGNAMQNLAAILTTRLATYYTPLPLMEMGTVALPLRPDIFPGCRFAYQPFLGGEAWEFYITSVTHKWVFGGPSTTELGLDRGLPQSIYQDASLMAQVLQGNAMRFNGTIVSGLPAGSGPALQTFNYATASLQVLLGQVAKIYVSPQQQ